MKKKTIFLCILFPVLIAAILGLWWAPIIDWLPIDQSGWKVLKSGASCYLDEDGDPVCGWLQTADGTYYLSQEGIPLTGWQEIGKNIYYLDGSGVLQSGWLELDEGNYYLSSDGIPLTGWQEIDGNVYYLSASGLMHTGWLELDGQRYYLRGNGQLHSGRLELEEGTYYLSEDGTPLTGWQKTDGGRCYLGADGRLHTGWLEQPEGKYYLDEAGIPVTGWLELESNRYYLAENGILQTGWLELDGQKYYLKEDGSAAKGKLVIDEKTYYFTSTGANIVLVNYWNPLPSTFKPETVKPKGLCWISAVCAEPALNMVNDLQAALDAGVLLNGYRPYNTQYNGFHEKVRALTSKGYSHATAVRKVRDAYAYPGTSEHQLGVALDVMNPTDLYYEKGETDVIRWLHEHCWEYGFIVRYPEGKSHITGIIYEPWHFRYVGIELAMEMKDSGLCLEEYLDNLTNDGTTCGDPASLTNK